MCNGALTINREKKIGIFYTKKLIELLLDCKKITIKSRVYN